MLKLWHVLFCQMAISITYHFVKANVCLRGQDISAKVRENSPPGAFVANLSIAKDPGANSIRLCLTGNNADWFYLEEKSIRLNTSISRVLDREVQGPVLIAALTCYEEDTIQGKIFQREYRITVEILNENDNAPAFAERTAQPFDVSEMTAVNAAVFSVHARDADNDPVAFAIDASSADASFFRIDRPKSGKVVLAKPLDYETKTRLQFVIYAVEANTKERHNSTAVIRVNVLDGDDQNPQFQPCTPLSQDETPPICTSPVYTVNISEKEQDSILHFSPGPIHAEDGDRGLMTPLIYTILSGADSGMFRIDNGTGEVVLTRRVESRLLTPELRLRIMASQRDDPKKYAVATALIRVLAENRFPPRFNRTAYRGYVTENSSPAALVNSHGDQLLVVRAEDPDFEDGVNPKLQYSLSPQPNSTGLYHVTQEGLVIARANRLHAPEKHLLQVLATDQESGEVVNASIYIEVLQKDQPVPQSPFGEGRLFGMGDVGVDVGVAGGLVGVIVLLLAAVLCLLLLLLRTQKKKKLEDPGEQGAPGKHPTMVNHGGARPLIDQLSYRTEALGDRDTSGAVSQGQDGVYTRRGSTANRERLPRDAPPGPQPQPGSPSPSTTAGGSAAGGPAQKSVSFQDEVTPEDAGVTPGDASGRAQVPRETKQEGVGTAREPPFRQSKETGKAAGGAGGRDKPDGAKRGVEDAFPKWLKEQEGKGEKDISGEIEVPENPYKL